VLRRRAIQLGILMTLAVFAAFFVVPIIWLVLAPTKTSQELVSDSPFAFGSFGNFAHAFRTMLRWQGGSLLVWLENSAIYCVSGTVLAVVAAVPAGYGLARTQFVGRRALLWITLVAMIMPANALTLPLFVELNDARLIGTAWSIILPFAFFPFGVYLAYIYFSSAVPLSLLAAARLDGAGEWRVFRHIALPLSLPIVVFVAFFAFVADWNNFYLPFVMTYDRSQYPIQVGLQLALVGVPAPDRAMATLVAISPIVILFVLAQRALAGGLLAGAFPD